MLTKNPGAGVVSTSTSSTVVEESKAAADDVASTGLVTNII
jgi:hypothetical protein